MWLALADARFDRVARVASGYRDFIGPHLEALQAVRPERARQRDVAGIAAPRDQYAADARRVVASVEGVPAVAQVGLEPAGKIHRPVRRFGAHVAQVAGAVAGGNVHAAAERDREVRVV